MFSKDEHTSLLQLQHRMPLSVFNQDAWIDGELVPFGADAILESLLKTVD